MRHAMFSDKASESMRGNEEEEDELAMPMVFSDVLKPARLKTGMTLSSETGSPRTPNDSRMGQQQAAFPAADNVPSSSSMRLAVEPEAGGAGTHTPVRPPTPDPLAGLGARSDASSSEPKKRGRPKGWRPGMPYSTDPNSRYRKREMRTAESQAGANTQEKRTSQGKEQNKNQETKRRGRPPRPPDPTIRERYLRSNPDYTPYKCEWDISRESSSQKPLICPAELQNMDTLRKHVFLVHGDTDTLECRFPHCRDHNPPIRFETEREFEHHMEKKHFVGYLWHLGEGYQNRGIETLKNNANRLPDYLFDKHGNQVTPSVTDQRLESEPEHKERKRRLKRLLLKQNENAPSEEEWMKQMLGIA
ncbi:hypothetical protein O1611_g5071 [Lasiodiplodia mahajangana]|uniref:Uncharacterized protein n=1 Tax=Lasiodiplodia mahajangana TaxID=1108764 RepID=A0ACC2JM79_9PEZI|nr:hypothetical protein O1611_g5071 [Lasiodiplodia mahajangana]